MERIPYRGMGKTGYQTVTIVHEGYHRINGIDVLNDLQEHSYVQAKNTLWSTEQSQLVYQDDEYINLKF